MIVLTIWGWCILKLACLVYIMFCSNAWGAREMLARKYRSEPSKRQSNDFSAMMETTRGKEYILQA